MRELSALVDQMVIMVHEQARHTPDFSIALRLRSIADALADIAKYLKEMCPR